MLIVFMSLHFAVITVALCGCGSTNKRSIFHSKLGAPQDTITCLDLKYSTDKDNDLKKPIDAATGSRNAVTFYFI